MSFVLTASARFNDTLSNIVKGLQDAGFSKEDYFAEELPEPKLSNEEILEQDLFEDSSSENMKSDDDFNLNAIDFNPQEEITLENYKKNSTIIGHITEKAVIESKSFEEKVNTLEIDDNTTFFTEVMKQAPKRYAIDNQFVSIVKTITLPQFFLKTETEELSQNILFEELTSSDYLLNKNSLLKGFNLIDCDTKVNFDEISAEIVGIDYDENKKTAVVNKFNIKAKSILVDTILSKPKQSQIKDISKFIVGKLGDMTPISEQDLTRYIGRVFESLSNDQIRDIIDNEFIYIQKIKNKINELSVIYSKQRFKMLLDCNEIFVKENFSFSEAINPINLSIAIGKSLYEREGTMNVFEQDMILTIANMDNIVFWHRNLTRGKGFFINGYYRDHYPDFIIYTQKGNIILIETKGDYFDNDDSKNKNKLGKIWAEKSGEHYKYFMVYQNKQVEDCYTSNTIVEVLNKL